MYRIGFAIVLSIGVLSTATVLRARAQGIPAQPGNVQVAVAADASALVVSWTTPAGAGLPAAHRLEFRLNGSSAVVAAVDLGAGNTFATAIPAGTRGTFTVTIIAFSGGQASQPSTPRLFDVGAGGPCTGPPFPPTGLRFTREGTALTMVWDPSAGAVEYILEAGSRRGASDIFVGSMGTRTELTATVPENILAFVRVRARNACGLSLVFNEIELGTLWSVSFRGEGLNANACVPNTTQGRGFCSQNIGLRGSTQFDEVWSPMTPVLRARGAFTPAHFTATLACLNGAAAGTMQATWNGVRYVGTADFGGSVVPILVTPGNYDPQCTQR